MFIKKVALVHTCDCNTGKLLTIILNFIDLFSVRTAAGGLCTGFQQPRLQWVRAKHVSVLLVWVYGNFVDFDHTFITRSLSLSSRGLPSQAFEYIMYNKGLMTEQDYPYKAVVTNPSS